MSIATTTKERPILFSAPMVRALLAGTKTQTRRIVKLVAFYPVTDANDMGQEVQVGEDIDFGKCPYGQPGDRLWVRETWRSPENGLVAYAADGRCGAFFGDGTGGRFFSPHGWLITAPNRGDKLGNTYGESKYGDRWRPSIHMPRWASRISLEITDVRVQRLNDISEEDAKAEGVIHGHGCWYAPGVDGTVAAPNPQSTARSAYALLWESISGAGSWDANPWVWAISFKRVAP